MAIVHLSNDKTFEAPSDVSLLDAARSAGLVLEHSCRSGRCRSCKAQVVSGRTIPIKPDLSLQPEERSAGWVLTCATAAATDLRLDIEDLGLPADIAVKTLPCRVDSIEQLAPDVLKVVLRLPPNAAMRYLAGQYIDVIGQGGLKRSYSIANVPDDDGKLELHIRQVKGGPMSAYWFEQAKPNDLLRFEGPRGTFFLRDTAGVDIVFLATGTGVAPIKSMLGELARRDSTHKPRSVKLIWGGRHRADLYWQPDFAALGLCFMPILSRADDSWTGAQGYVQHALLQSHPDWSNTAVYACGSPAMIDSARIVTAEAGLSPKRFFWDAFVSSN